MQISLRNYAKKIFFLTYAACASLQAAQKPDIIFTTQPAPQPSNLPHEYRIDQQCPPRQQREISWTLGQNRATQSTGYQSFTEEEYLRAIGAIDNLYGDSKPAEPVIVSAPSPQIPAPVQEQAPVQVPVAASQEQSADISVDSQQNAQSSAPQDPSKSEKIIAEAIIYYAGQLLQNKEKILNFVSEQNKIIKASQEKLMRAEHEARERAAAAEQEKERQLRADLVAKVEQRLSQTSSAVQRSSQASSKGGDSGTFSSEPASSQEKDETEKYLIPMAWNWLKSYWSSPQPTQPKVYDHTTWRADISKAKTAAERAAIDLEHQNEKEKERSKSEKERIDAYRAAQKAEEAQRQAAEKEHQQATAQSDVAAKPLETFHHRAWMTSLAAANSPEQHEAINTEFQVRKETARHAAESYRVASLRNDPRRVPIKVFNTVDVCAEIEQVVLKKRGEKAAKELWSKAAELEQARVEREKAECERDRVLAERARAPHDWDFAEGTVPTISAEEKARIDAQLAEIPDNIEELASRAAKKVEKIKKGFAYYQGAHQPESPNAARRKQVAEKMRAYQEAEAKKKAHVQRMLDWQENDRKQYIKDEQSGKNWLRRLVGIAIGGFSGGGGGPAVRPSPSGAATATGASTGWLSGLGARVGALFYQLQMPKGQDTSKKEDFKPLTNKEARKLAEQLGFKKTNYYSHGRPIFQKGNNFISPDIDAHKGGVWKMANSIEGLASKATRSGTYDKNLKRIGN